MILERNPDWIKFRQWLKENGLLKHPLCLKEFSDTGRGLMATKRIDSVIVNVPLCLMLTSDAAIQRFPIHASEQALLGLLLCERVLFDPHFVYQSILPTSFDTAFYLTDYLHLLPRDIQKRHKDQVDQFERDYRSILDSTHWIPTKRFYLWAWFCVHTRSITMNTSRDWKERPRIALVPLLDCLNHSPDAKIHAGFDETKQSYIITTASPIERGNQVFIHYGPHDNLFLMGEYGFVTPDNPHDHLKMDHLVKFQSKHLETYGLLGDYTIAPGDFGYRLMAVLRLQHCEYDDLKDWHLIQKGVKSAMPSRIEIKALVSLQKLVQIYLKESEMHLLPLEGFSSGYRTQCALFLVKNDIQMCQVILTQVQQAIDVIASQQF